MAKSSRPHASREVATTSKKPGDEDADAVTRLLERWTAGDHAALDRLMPLIYASLKSLAAGYLRRERAGHTLQPTAVVRARRPRRRMGPELRQYRADAVRVQLDDL
jgi:hypothetical protein